MSSGEKLEQVTQKLFFTGIKLLSKTMDTIEKGGVPRVKQSLTILQR
ncbi:hypothetical protein [Methanosarcina sp. UBA289]